MARQRPVRIERGRIRKYFVGMMESTALYVERRSGSTWAVATDYRECLTKNGQLIDEPQPSERTEAFLKRTRWETFDAAHAAAERMTR